MGGSSRTGHGRSRPAPAPAGRRAGEPHQVIDQLGHVSWCGGMKSASCGPNEVPPIQTCSSRHRPAISGCSRPTRALCIARIASASSRRREVERGSSSPRRCRRSQWRCVCRCCRVRPARSPWRRPSGSRSTKTRPTRSGATRPQTGPRRRPTRRRTGPSRPTPPRSPRVPPRGGQGPVSNPRHDGRAVRAGMATAHARRDQIERDPRRPRPNFRPESGPIGRRRHASNIASISR